MGATTRVQRITLPRYEVEYSDPKAAFDDACRIRDGNILMLEHTIAGEVGSEVVFDLAVTGLAFTITLLFRVIARQEQRTVLEWWARRATDPDMLALYIESLNQQVNAAAHGGDQPAPSLNFRRMLETCRRALSHNPFTSLNVHWSAGPAEVAEAVARTRADLEGLRRQPNLPVRVTDLAAKALEELPRAAAQLTTLEGRRRARALFIPADQLRQARDLAVSRAEIARLRGDAAEIARTSIELDELQTRAPR